MKTEKYHAGAFLIKSTLDHYSRLPVTVPEGTILEVGAVVGITTAASGSDPAIVAEYNNALSDGSEVVAGIMYERVDATDGDAKGVMVVAGRGDHIVNKDLLVWGSGIDAGEQATALAALAAKGVFTAA